MTNPILLSDFPDPDVIRVNDTYYMISTTMHFMPGGVILRSFDLVHWEIFHYVYDQLEETDRRMMKNGQNIYGQGMWAASLGHHKGMFYVVFCCNDNQKTYIYHSPKISGPWTRQQLEGFYHDSSLFFEEGGRVFLVHGNRDIFLTELEPDLTRPKPGGINKIIITDEADVRLGYEGAHLQKIKGKYYISLIHWYRKSSERRVQAIMMADRIDGPYTGGDVLDDDMGFHNMGVAQGGLVDTPEGDWYALLFQDRGALGRVPVLLPVSWKNHFPQLGRKGAVPLEFEVKSTRPGFTYETFAFSDDFRYQPDDSGNILLRKGWEWNHIPDNSLWSIDSEKGQLQLQSGEVVKNLVQARNTLTMRTIGSRCSASVYLDGRRLKQGDFAGICAFQGRYGLIAMTKEGDRYFLVMLEKPGQADMSMGQTNDQDFGVEQGRVEIPSPAAELKVSFNFENMIDEALFYYRENTIWKQLGIRKKLYFGLDHFCGCRIGLFHFSTSESGGTAGFQNFVFT